MWIGRSPWLSSGVVVMVLVMVMGVCGCSDKKTEAPELTNPPEPATKRDSGPVVIEVGPDGVRIDDEVVELIECASDSCDSEAIERGDARYRLVGDDGDGLLIPALKEALEVLAQDSKPGRTLRMEIQPAITMGIIQRLLYTGSHAAEDGERFSKTMELRLGDAEPVPFKLPRAAVGFGSQRPPHLSVRVGTDGRLLVAVDAVRLSQETLARIGSPEVTQSGLLLMDFERPADLVDCLEKTEPALDPMTQITVHPTCGTAWSVLAESMKAIARMDSGPAIVAVCNKTPSPRAQIGSNAKALKDTVCRSAVRPLTPREQQIRQGRLRGQTVRKNRPKTRSQIRILSASASCDQAGVNQVIRMRRKALRYCHEKTVPDGPLENKMTLAWRVDAEGGVMDAQVRSATLQNQSILGCAQRQLARWTFPNQGADCQLEVSYVFSRAEAP